MTYDPDRRDRAHRAAFRLPAEREKRHLARLLLTVLLRKENPTFALLVTVAGAGLLFYTVSKLAGSAFGILGDLKTAAGDTGAYIDLMFKILGISIVTQVVCDVCRDNGASALASQTETAAKILVLSLLLPLFQTVIGIVTGLVK